MNWFTSPYNQTVKVAVLRRFQVTVGKESAFEACLENFKTEPITKKSESTKVGSVFTKQNDERLHLYWLSIEKPDTQAFGHCQSTVIKPLLDCIDLTSYREFEPDQSMFEELKGPFTRHDQYLPGFVMASLVEAAPTGAIF